MKVLIYTRAFPPLVGGTETIIMVLARGLAQHLGPDSRKNVDLTVVTPTPANGTDDSRFGFKVIRQPKLITLIRLMRQFDIIHVAGPIFVPMILGLLLRKTVVIEHHGFQVTCPNGQLYYEPAQTICPGHFMARRYHKCVRCNASNGTLRSLKMLLLTFPRRWLCQHVSVNILPTEWLSTVLRLRRSVTIHHGIPSFQSKAASPTTPTVPTFTFFGRLVGTKGACVLLNAARELHAKKLSFRIKIIGQGPDRESLENLARDLQINDKVQFLGYVSSGDVEKCLADATAIVVPSVAGEVFGLVALENMLRGKLVIVSDIGSLREVVADAGLIFPVQDATALASFMQHVLEAPLVPASLGAAARQRALQLFDDDMMIESHISAYRRALLRSSPSP